MSLAGGVVYPIYDSLQNLRIGIKCERLIAGATGAPSFQQYVSSHSRPLSQSQTTEPTNEQNVDPKKRVSIGDVDEYVFKWQEKVFNKVEYETYSLADNCRTDLQMQYHKKVQELRAQGGRPTVRLFSYIEGDDYTETQRALTTAIIGNKAAKTVSSDASNLADTVVQARRRRRIVPQSRQSSHNPITDAPPKHTWPTHKDTVKIMYIMLHTGSLDSTDTFLHFGETSVLCTLKVINDERLIIDPDFTQPTQKPYKVEGKIGVFSYTISNASSAPVLPAIQRSLIDVHERQMSAMKAEMMASNISGEFDVPESNVLKTLLLSEIVSATGFEYDNICVHYVTELPKGWYSATKDPLEGVTPICTSTPNEFNIAVQHFGHIFELALCLNMSIYDELDRIPVWPQLYICVMALSNMNVHRTEGYACVALPTIPGTHEVTVNTWRPIESRVDELRRCFVGGSPELTNINSAGIVKDHGSHQSKLGLTTVASGSVTLRFHVIHQCRNYISEERQKQLKYGAVMQRLGTNVQMHSSIIAVLEAFQRARQRMLTVRENLSFGQDLLENL